MLLSPRPHRSVAAPLLALAALALTLAACDSTHGLNLAPDQPPTVTITSGPIDTVSAPQSWLVDIAWTASDPGGRVDHFEYAIDPPTLQRARMAMAETAWVQTKENHVVAHFRASHPDSLGKPGETASDFHVFVLRAVDDRGGRSANVVRAFYAYTVAPDAKFIDPAPNPLLPAHVGIPFRLTWSGNDPDGPGTGQPAAYRLRLLPIGSGQNVAYLMNPDSLLELGAANNWADWRTVGGDTTALAVSDTVLAADTRWMAAILAVDDAGATTPYLTFDRNLLVFDVLATGGPAVHVFSNSNFYDYTGLPSSVSYTPPVEVPVNVPLSFTFEGVPSSGRRIIGTRWALDNENVNDATPRSNEQTDLTHWSVLHQGPVTATFRFALPGQHVLGIQSFDDFGGSSVLFVRLTVVGVTLDKDLLVVDDTRLEVDKIPSGAPRPNVYTLPWPSRTELDTFLFARGGYPWRGTQNPATGVVSPPGLLAGYQYDTLGTRRGLENPVDGTPLELLARYRHVLWMVDARGALNGPGVGTFPITVLRAMSQPGVVNTLEQYVRLGGQVWLAGAGTAYASLIAFDDRSNNLAAITVFDTARSELAPKRILYDMAHIRSSIGVGKSDIQVTRSTAAVGGWSGHGPDGTLAAPDYSHLPAAMRHRDPATDPLPPTRTASQASLYYPTLFSAGFVLEPNVITEKFGPDSLVESTLDTLYDASGTMIPIPAAPVMTYYHGRDNAPFVYTGFEPWDWSRADCQGLVDFVLGDIWKLAKSAPGSIARASSTSLPPAALPARAPQSSRRSVVQMRR